MSPDRVTLPTFSPEAEKYPSGTLIGGKYKLGRMLGEGGMGSVWAAHNVALDSAVAIKLIRGEGNREDMALRLLQEARAAARLGHPAIVRVFDIGQTEQGDPFIVMELLEGESLGARLFRDYRLSAVESVKLLLPIADALRAAHAKGIVHRDIKPDNVFLATDGAGYQPKLVDFGIAKLEQRELATHQTERGVVVGSPDYMSPEQARGEETIDHRSDIWSFCVVLYQTLSGVPPFTGPNYNALLRSIVEDKPVPLSSHAAGDSELAAILDVGMSKDRAARFRSIDELGVALAAWLARQGVFEDAAGGSLDARWLNRNSDSGRNSRASFASLHGEPTPQSGVLATVRPAGAAASAHAPTSLAPASVRSRRFRGMSWTVLAVGVAALVVLAAAWSRRTPQPEAPVAQTTPAAAAVEPARVAVAGPVPPSVAPTSQPVPEPVPAVSGSAPRTRDRAKKAPQAGRPETRRNLDLMSPY